MVLCNVMTPDIWGPESGRMSGSHTPAYFLSSPEACSLLATGGRNGNLGHGVTISRPRIV